MHDSALESEDDDGWDEEYIQSACQVKHGYRARPFQMRAAKSMYDGKDTVVISPTGSGKSLCIGLAFMGRSISPSAMVIVITPLKALQAEQSGRDDTAIFVNAENKTPELLKEIADKKHRVIFMGPEQLQTSEVRKILKKREWNKNLIGYIVDEAHVVPQWEGA